MIHEVARPRARGKDASAQSLNPWARPKVWSSRGPPRIVRAAMGTARTKIGRLIDWAAGRHLRAVDEESELPPGRVSPEARVTIVYLVGAATLILISYGVLAPGIQRGAGQQLLEILAALSPEAAADARKYLPLIENMCWAVGCFTFYFVLPALIIRRVFGHKLSDYGLTGKGFWSHLPIYLLLFIPVVLLVLLVAENPDFQKQYPFYKNPHGVWDFVIWECFYALQFFSLEFFFRGFMLHGVKDKLGRFAVFAMVIPYAMIHFRKPMYETVGAVIAGSVLGVLSLRTGSIWGGWLIHIAVAISMDIAAMSMRGG